MMGYGLGVGWWDVDVGFGHLRASFGFAISPLTGVPRWDGNGCAGGGRFSFNEGRVHNWTGFELMARGFVDAGCSALLVPRVRGDDVGLRGGEVGLVGVSGQSIVCSRAMGGVSQRRELSLGERRLCN